MYTHNIFWPLIWQDHVTQWVKHPHRLPNSSINAITDVGRMKVSNLSLDRAIFNQAAHLIRNSANGLLGLRLGDALHLALALRVGAVAFFSLDVKLAESAKQSKLLAVNFSVPRTVYP